MKPDLSSNPRRLSVVHVTLGLNMGGMEKLLVEFAKHTDRERFLPRFVSLTDRGSLAAEIEANGAEVFTLDTPPGLRPGLVLRLARLFRRLGADIVHTHNTKPLIYASPAARLANVSALVHTRHGQRFGASARSNLAFRLAALGADRIVSISADSARLSVREGIAPAKVCTILNGIDVSRFAYSGPNLGGAAVMVGRQTPDGRQITGLFFPHLVKDFPAIKRFQVVQEVIDRIDISLVLVGELPQTDRSRLEAEIRKVFGPEMSINLVAVDDIPLTRAGKHQVIVNRLK